MARPISSDSNRQKAIAAGNQGETKFNGTQCPRCNSTLKYVSKPHNCVQCSVLKSARYRQEHPTYHYEYHRL